MRQMEPVMTNVTASNTIVAPLSDATFIATVVDVPASPWLNPTQLQRPAFLLNFPFSLSTEVANNVWMQDLPVDRRQPNFTRATIQFLELYRALAGEALVYLLPSPRGIQL